MDFDDAAHQRQPDARALGSGVEFVEQAEDRLVVARIDADAIVAHEEDPGGLGAAQADLDARLRLVAGKLQGVFDQILPHLGQPLAIRPDDGEPGLDHDLGVALDDRPGEQAQDVAQQHIECHRSRRLRDPADAREFEEIGEKRTHLVGRVGYAAQIAR